MRKLSLLIVITGLLAVACTEQRAPGIRSAAEFYVQRFDDTVSVDTAAGALDSLPFTPVGLDSLTAGWTADDWEAFWQEVDALRRQQESTAKAEG